MWTCQAMQWYPIQVMNIWRLNPLLLPVECRHGRLLWCSALISARRFSIMDPLSVDNELHCKETNVLSSSGAGMNVCISAANRSIGCTTGCTITEKAPTRAFSWLKAPTSAFTFKTLLRYYAKRALTPRSLNVKLGPRHKGHKGRAVWLA